MPQRRNITAFDSTFTIDAEYIFLKELGQGLYGNLISATHRRSGERCAIKKITNINNEFKPVFTKRCLTEIRLLLHFRDHRNITCLYDMDIAFQPSGNFDSVYLHEELMESDLNVIIHSDQKLSDEHVQAFVYQSLCGLKYIHSAHVIHRNLKPGNLLVNADCTLKICDLGLGRGFHPKGNVSGRRGQQGFMTETVSTRWYRAPECMLSFDAYGTAIDIWAIGCIFAELLGRKPIHKGRDYVDQINQILHYSGTPSEDTLRRIASPRSQDYIRSLPVKPPVHLSNVFPKANPLAIDLLSKMLSFDPVERISCEGALSHAYLEHWHDPDNEPICESLFDSSYEEALEGNLEGMSKLIVEEVTTFRAFVRAQA